MEEPLGVKKLNSATTLMQIQPRRLGDYVLHRDAPTQTGGPCLTRTYLGCLRGAACRVVVGVDVVFLRVVP